MMLLTAIVICVWCGQEYRGHWLADAELPEEVDEPPTQTQRCPQCGHEQEEEYPGWAFRTEPG